MKAKQRFSDDILAEFRAKLSLKHWNPNADMNRCMDQIAHAPVATPHTHEREISTAKTILITVGSLFLLWSLGLAVAVALDAR